MRASIIKVTCRVWDCQMPRRGEGRTQHSGQLAAWRPPRDLPVVRQHRFPTAGQIPVRRQEAVIGAARRDIDACGRTKIVCAVTSRCRKSHPPSSLIRSTPKSQAPLATNDGEKIINGDGSVAQWVVSAGTAPIAFVIPTADEFCLRDDFVLLEKSLRLVVAAAVLLCLAGFSPNTIT